MINNDLSNLFQHKILAEDKPENDIDAQKVGEHLSKHIYENIEPQYTKNFPGMQKQILQLCDHMLKLGFTNFADLTNKFNDAPEDGQNDKKLMLDAIKQRIETILYKVENSTIPKAELIAKYKDWKFACEEGTLTNLDLMLKQLSLEGQGIDAYLISKKREILTQIVLKIYHNVTMDELSQSWQGMEIHDISSLLNSIAKKYKLIKKTKAEDHHIKEISPSNHDLLVRKIEEELSKQNALGSFFDVTAGEIIANLPNFNKESLKQEGGYRRFQQNLEDALKQLDLEISFPDLLKFDDDLNIEGYKSNVDRIIKNAIILNLHNRKILKNVDIKLVELQLEIERDNLISEDLLKRAKEQGKLAEIIKYALFNNIKIGELDAFIYALQNDIQIDDVSLMEFMLINDLQIDDRDALKYAIDNNLFINISVEVKDGATNELKTIRTPISPFDYMKMKNLKINGNDYLQYAIKNNILIEDIDPIIYAYNAGIELDGNPALYHALINNLTIEGAPAIEYVMNNPNHEMTKNQAFGLAILNDVKVGDMLAVEYFAEKGYTCDGLSAYAYILKHESKIREQPAIDYLVAKKALVDGLDPIVYAIKNKMKFGGQEAIEYAIRGDININGETPWKYAIDHNILLQGKSLFSHINYWIPNQLPKIDGIDIILYAQSKGIKLENGLSPLEYAIIKDWQINDIPAVHYVVQNGIKINDQYDDAAVFALDKEARIDHNPAIDYFIENKIKVAGIDAAEYALKHNIKINRQYPLNYFLKNNLKVEGMTALDYAIKNNIKAWVTAYEGHPIEYMLKHNILVDGQNPLKYVLQNKIIIDNRDPNFYVLIHLIMKYKYSASDETKSDLEQLYQELLELNDAKPLINFDSILAGWFPKYAKGDSTYNNRYDQVKEKLQDIVKTNHYSLPLLVKCSNCFNAMRDDVKAIRKEAKRATKLAEDAAKDYEQSNLLQKIVINMDYIFMPITNSINAVYNIFYGSRNQIDNNKISFDASFAELIKEVNQTMEQRGASNVEDIGGPSR